MHIFVYCGFKIVQLRSLVYRKHLPSASAASVAVGSVLDQRANSTYSTFLQLNHCSRRLDQLDPCSKPSTTSTTPGEHLRRRSTLVGTRARSCQRRRCPHQQGRPAPGRSRNKIGAGTTDSGAPRPCAGIGRHGGRRWVGGRACHGQRHERRGSPASPVRGLALSCKSPAGAARRIWLRRGGDEVAERTLRGVGNVAHQSRRSRGGNEPGSRPVGRPTLYKTTEGISREG